MWRILSFPLSFIISLIYQIFIKFSRNLIYEWNIYLDEYLVESSILKTLILISSLLLLMQKQSSL